MAQPPKSRIGNKHGFTLIELMVVVVIIGILATIGLMNYRSAKARAADATVKADLKNAMVCLEDYRIQNDEYPRNRNQFMRNSGFNLSPGVTWDRYRRRTVRRAQTTSVIMVLYHESSGNKWRADFPFKSSSIILQ